MSKQVVLLRLAVAVASLVPLSCLSQTQPIELGGRRELFVSDFLIERLNGASLRLGTPTPEQVVMNFDLPWEIPFSGAHSVIKDGDIYRMYYRGANTNERGEYDEKSEVTCYAESRDGINWTKPILGLHEYKGNKANNIILPPNNPRRASHNFAVFVDTRPGVKPEERYKGVGGTREHGLFRYVSADGIRWKLFFEEPLFLGYYLDTLNVAGWSPAEKCYVAFIRPGPHKAKNPLRTISRATSPDFVNWSEPVEVDYGNTPAEHIYTNATHPYFRAPHILIALPFRFMPERAVLSAAEHTKLGTHYTQRKGVSDAVLMTSRGGPHYDRTFMESFVRPGLHRGAWGARSNLPSLGVVQTGPNEMSFYLTTHHTMYDYHMRRYALRLDGFASVNAPFAGGQVTTKPLVFSGSKLSINYSTSSIGHVKAELLDQSGRAVAGFALEDCDEIVGDEIERIVTWKGSSDVSSLAGRPVRLRFAMKDADLYALQFQP